MYCILISTFCFAYKTVRISGRNLQYIYLYIKVFLLLQIRIPLRGTNFIFLWSSRENTKYFPQYLSCPLINTVSELCYCVKLIQYRIKSKSHLNHHQRQPGVRVRNSLIIKSKDSLLHNVRRVGNVWNISSLQWAGSLKHKVRFKKFNFYQDIPSDDGWHQHVVHQQKTLFLL